MKKNRTAVLIIEDDNSMSGFLVRSLESRGFEATVAPAKKSNARLRFKKNP